MTVIPSTGTKRKMGRPSAIEAYHEIMEIVSNFITQHSISTHNRKSDDVHYNHGVTLSAISSHVLREISALKQISIHTTTIFFCHQIRTVMHL